MRISLLLLVIAAAPAIADDWPQWRGPRRDNHVAGFKTPGAWPKELKKHWSVTVGVGESSPLLVGDKLYAFSRQGGEEVTRCLDAGSGKEIWKDAYKAEAVTGPASGFPGPRATPAIVDGKICTLGVGGVVSCLDAQSGKVVWRHDTKAKPRFYTSSSPLALDGKAVVFVDQLTAFQAADGSRGWAAKAGDAPYGSPVVATLAGVPQIVTPAAGQLAGVAQDDGRVLWTVALDSAYQSSYSTPLVDGDVVYYFAPGGKGGKGGKGGGGAGGARALKIEKKGDGLVANETWKKTATAAGYHTPVLRDGLIFGVNSARNFFCMDAKDGETLWVDKDHARGQCGSILSVGPVLVSLTSDKELVVFRPSRKAYEEIAKYSVAESWSVPILAGNRIYVKDKAGALTLWTLD